jgi:hypothetical protein
MTEVRDMTSIGRLSLGLFVAGMFIGLGGAAEAGFIGYSLSGSETCGLNFGGQFDPMAFDPVSITMGVDTSTIVNDPTHSTLSPGYVTGTTMVTVSVSDPTFGQLTTTVMAHARVFQTFVLIGGFGGFFTEIDFIADSGPFKGNTIGQALMVETTGNPPVPVGNPLPITYDLKSSIGPFRIDSGGIFYEFPTSGGTFQLGGVRPDNPFLNTNINFQATLVPEPPSSALCGVAIALVVAAARWRRIWAD